MQKASFLQCYSRLKCITNEQNNINNTNTNDNKNNDNNLKRQQ